MVSGVAGGIAEYFEIDATVVRLLWLFAVLWGGAGFLAYIVAWIVIPANPDGPTNPTFERTEHWRESVYETARDVEQRIRKTDGGPRPAGSGSTARTHPSGESSRSTNPRKLLGWVLIILGVLYLLQKLIPWAWLFFRSLWPIALIVLGLVLILREVRR